VNWMVARWQKTGQQKKVKHKATHPLEGVIQTVGSNIGITEDDNKRDVGERFVLLLLMCICAQSFSVFFPLFLWYYYFESILIPLLVFASMHVSIPLMNVQRNEETKVLLKTQ